MRNICCVEDCDRPVVANKMCKRHYYRQLRGGNPHEKSRFEKTDVERFYEKIVKQPNGCWEWTGHRDAKGYGRYSSGGFVSAHRFAYGTFVGPIPENMYVCHTCDNPSCANPEHLFVGTAKDNNNDMAQKGRHGRGGGTRKLSAQEVTDIYKAEGTIGATELGKKYKIDRNTVYAIWKQRIWHKITSLIERI